MEKINKFIIAGIFAAIFFILATAAPGIVGAQYAGCTYHSYERCSGNYLYWYDSCGNQQDVAQYCLNGCYGGSCQNYNNNNYNSNNGCTYHSYQRCSGNNLYWYDSCGNQQDLIQYCQNGCYNGICQGNYNQYGNGNCTYHAYKMCSGNNLYWYDSCENQQDLYYNCANSGQVCQYGQCVAYAQPNNNYSAHSTIACYGSSLYWYDSLGVASGLYKNCSDNNNCTIDSCSAGKCSNIIKCDGSMCAVGSADYNNYCASAQNHCGNGLCEPNLGETTANCPNDCKININTNSSGLSVSFFAKQDPNSSQWQKTTQADSNGQVYFMISAANNSTAQIDNVNISANIPGEISSLGNLKINGVSFSGDIVSGVNIGSIAPSTTKSITFEGKTQAISSASTKQATATANVSGSMQSDFVSINFSPNQAAAAVSSVATTPGFWGFLKRWYLWILVGLVLIFLFVIIFRRLSSNI